MNSETFYYSRWRQWIFGSVGAISLFCGLLNLGLFFHGSQFFKMPALSAFSFVVIGLIIILISLQQKKTALYLTLFAIAFAIFYATFFLLTQNSPVYKTLTQVLFYPEEGCFVHKSLTSGIIFLFLEVALLFNILTSKHSFFWIAGACAAIVLGFGLYFASFNLTELKFMPFINVYISTSTAILSTLIAAAVLFYCGTRFAYLSPFAFTIWLPTFATIVALFLILTTWITYDAHEKTLVNQDNMESAALLKERLIEHGSVYFSTLNRMAKRWSNLGLQHLRDSFLNTECDAFSTFPWLQEFGLVNVEKKIVDLKSPNLPADAFAIYPLLEFQDTHKKSSDQLHVFFANSPTTQTSSLFAFSPFLGMDAKEKTYFFSIANAWDFFAASIHNLLKGEHAILISTASGVIYSLHGEDLKYKHHFLSKETLDFFGTPLEIELWPFSSYLVSKKSSTSIYQLMTGLIFCFTLFWALYMALVAFRKKKEADKANKEKTMFLANMSHEIRTPLHGIIGSCSLLELSQLDEYQKKWVNGINRSGKMLLELLDELLDMSKIEANAITIEPHTIDLKDLIEEIFISLKPAAEAKQLDFQLAYSPTLKNVFFLDGRRVRQILVHLLSNAIKFTQHGFVRLTIAQNSSDADHVLIFRVEDSGIGISKQRLQNIFKTYLNIDIRTEKGSGLGLAITKRLVELMKGNIIAESQEGDGSVFTVRIPVKGGEKNG